MCKNIKKLYLIIIKKIGKILKILVKILKEFQQERSKN